MRLKEQREGAKEKKNMLSVSENWWKQTTMKTYHNCPVNHENKGGSSSKTRLLLDFSHQRAKKEAYRL